MYAHAVSALLSAPRNHMNPTSVISGPTRFSGRRHQAKMPAPANAQPSVSASTIHAVESSLAIARRDQRERCQSEREAGDGERDERAAKAAHEQTLTAQPPARTSTAHAAISCP